MNYVVLHSPPGVWTRRRRKRVRFLGVSPSRLIAIGVLILGLIAWMAWWRWIAG